MRAEDRPAVERQARVEAQRAYDRAYRRAYRRGRHGHKGLLMAGAALAAASTVAAVALAWVQLGGDTSQPATALGDGLTEDDWGALAERIDDAEPCETVFEPGRPTDAVVAEYERAGFCVVGDEMVVTLVSFACSDGRTVHYTAHGHHWSGWGIDEGTWHGFEPDQTAPSTDVC